MARVFLAHCAHTGADGGRAWSGETAEAKADQWIAKQWQGRQPAQAMYLEAQVRLADGSEHWFSFKVKSGEWKTPIRQRLTQHLRDQARSPRIAEDRRRRLSTLADMLGGYSLERPQFCRLPN